MTTVTVTRKDHSRGRPVVAESPDPRRWWALVLLALAEFMVILDASIVNIALPSIQRGLHFSKDNLSWVVNAYILAFGGLLLLGGRMADLRGRRHMFIVGLGVFAGASLVGGLSGSQGQLIASRAVQGVGAAMLAPAALALVTTIFSEGAERNKALGIWGAVAGSGAAAGVLLGGVLTSGLSWRWVLFVNVPVAFLAALLAPRLLSESRAQATRRSFDLAGAISVTAGLTSLVYALIEAQKVGWGTARTIGLLATATMLLVGFVIIELRAPAPLVPFAIFRLRAVAGANAVALLVGAALISMFFFLTLYMQEVLGYSAIKAGLSQLPLAGTIILAAALAPHLVGRIGPRLAIAIGLGLLGGGLVWFAQIPTHGVFLDDLLGPSLIIAAGLGLTYVPMTIASVSGVSKNQTGLASGLINTTQQVGGALGLAIAATVANSQTDHYLRAAHRGTLALRAALTHGFRAGFLVDAGFATLGILAALTLIQRIRFAADQPASEPMAQPAAQTPA
jgi:EmrB/QacA subfamily drug resistance transporter